MILTTRRKHKLAKTVYNVESLTLQDGTEVEVRPLNIKQLRKFMEIIEKMKDAETEMAGFEVLVDACAVCLSNAAPDLVADRDKLEEALDIPTINRILEVCGGIKMDDNSPEAQTAG
jgi:hypothetical protein